MNPYERYYLRQKLLTAALGVGAAALVVGGVLLWHPWDREKPQDTPEPPPVVEDEPVVEDKPDVTITVGGKKVDCRYYEGDGWRIPVPMDWTIEENGNTVTFIPPGSSADGSCLSVTVGDSPLYTGEFISAGTADFGGETGFERLFYSGDTRGFDVLCRMKAEEVELYEKTMNAMARTMEIGGESPFASLYPMASEPEWQVVDGEVVLFLDKDGVDIASVAAAATEKRMNGWSSEYKAHFTGKYRIGEPAWVDSYTCVVDEFVEVFAMPVEYQVNSGEASDVTLSEGQLIRNGWLSDENAVLYVAVFNDGSAVTRTVTAWSAAGYDGAEFASEVIAGQ